LGSDISYTKEDAMKYSKPKIVAGNKIDAVFAAGCRTISGGSLCSTCKCS